MPKTKPRTATLKIANCAECPAHLVQPDPDPLDDFCDDDVKVVCKVAGRTVSSGCRPYNVARESPIPSWCPLINKPRRAKAKVSSAR